MNLIYDLPFAAYRALDAVNISSLKHMQRSPLHYRHALTAAAKTSPAMALGTAAHAAVLEPQRFVDEFVVFCGAVRRGKDWDAFSADAEARKLTVVTEAERSTALSISESVRACPDAMRYLQAGAPEVTMLWDCMGIACKGRADWLTPAETVLVGLKTTRDCRPREFGRQAAQLGYHLQWAFYADGMQAITGRAPKVVEIVVESAAPHAVAVYVIPDAVLDQGREEYLALLDQLAGCRETDNWPGPIDGEVEFSLPAWVYGDAGDIVISDAEAA